VGPRAGLDGCENSSPQVVLSCVTLLYSAILKLDLSGLKLNTLQVLLPEDGGRLPKHVGGKTVSCCHVFNLYVQLLCFEVHDLLLYAVRVITAGV
jgi:hypothetical protein